MSPLVASHATRQCCRTSIRQHGLLGNRPAILQPFGVYVFNDDLDHPTWSRGSYLRWTAGRRHDVWQVAYIGPLAEDRLVANSLVLLEPVPPQHVTLVTCNK